MHGYCFTLAFSFVSHISSLPSKRAFADGYQVIALFFLSSRFEIRFFLFFSHFDVWFSDAFSCFLRCPIPPVVDFPFNFFFPFLRLLSRSHCQEQYNLSLFRSLAFTPPFLPPCFLVPYRVSQPSQHWRDSGACWDSPPARSPAHTRGVAAATLQSAPSLALCSE